MNKFDMMGKDAFNRVEEIMNATKLNEFLHRKEEEEKKKNLRTLDFGNYRRCSCRSRHCLRSVPFSLRRIIWRILKTTLRTILTTTSSMRRKLRQ